MTSQMGHGNLIYNQTRGTKPKFAWALSRHPSDTIVTEQLPINPKLSTPYLSACKMMNKSMGVRERDAAETDSICMKA